MNQTYLNKLEYYQILEKLKTYCHTYIGKEVVENLEPSNDIETVKTTLAETREAVGLIERNSTPPISEIDDIGIYLKLLESSSAISAKALLSVVNVLEMSDELIEYFSSFINTNDFPNLINYFSGLYTNHSIVDKIKKCVIDENTIADNSSNNLANIRRRERRLEQDIKSKLNTILHSSSYSKYIQENVVTIRNDRYVIPIKQEYRSYVKGFVHDMSASGSTVFIEPLAVFEYNNELNNLKIDEAQEIEKILYSLSSMLFAYTNEIKQDSIIIGNLDFIFAKAKYSNSIKGVTPTINTEKFANFINARHPLIDESKVVPTSLSIGKDFSLLIITGPNTGGKTVTLKTVGLLELMACSGLNIPADEKSSIYVFDEIFADIGDDQSISDSLSTFSSHMINISNILKTATENSLILVDELGSGTDPIEGANLAISILEYFKNNNILTIATTHYQELKRYALVTNDVQNASVEFDIENLKPTYRLLLGIPGKSNAFAISEKLGIKKEIIDKARSLMDKQDVDIENLLKKIYDDKIEIEREKEEIQKNLNQVEVLKKNLQRDDSKLKMQEQELINNAKVKARDILLDAKNEASKLISEMKQIEQTSGAVDKLNNLRNKLNSSIKEKSINDTVENVAVNPISRDLIKNGVKVYITNLNQNGIVTSSKINKNDEVQVQIGLIKTNVNIKYLENPRQLKNDLTKPVISSNPKVSKTRSANSEINVIGMTVDEAIPLVDKFLDDCFLAKIQTARIVHGKGTGKLRTAIQAFLKKHKRVKSFRVGSYGEGEMGVTVVELK